jgi:asparagine N-glycosylation enzyme membrane subunit Stt3
VLGKLVFLLGAAVLALAVLHELGFELPPAIPESLVIVVIGALATIFVLIRLISIPDRFFPWDGRGIGIWIALVAAIGVIVAGILRASEEL